MYVHSPLICLPTIHTQETEQDKPTQAMYEEVDEVRTSHDIQLTANEAYGPVQKSTIIQTSPNEAYGQVQL